ncbi:MAG TPA: thiamine-phosphate kinase [Thermoleophilaceae bacterium]|jgi:thiamine-monophosphate kinase
MARPRVETSNGASAALLVAAASGETELVGALRHAVEDCPFQANGAFEADAELLDVGGDELLAITVDTLQAREELATATSGYGRGWLAATASLSDLAAVGARPVAVLTSCCFDPARIDTEEAQELGRGASDAARAQDAYLVGGDTNWSGEESITSTAVGLVPRGRLLTRVGASAGDALYATGPVGGGNAAGARSLLGEEAPSPWLPSARCAAGRALRDHARACIDTSDGLVTSALLLADLNGTGFEIDDAPGLYDPAGLALARRLGLPSWLLAAGEWGEFELLLAVAPDAEAGCLEALAGVGAPAVRVGRLTAEPEFAIVREDGSRVDALDVAQSLRSVERDGGLVAQLAALVGRAG